PLLLDSAGKHNALRWAPRPIFFWLGGINSISCYAPHTVRKSMMPHQRHEHARPASLTTAPESVHWLLEALCLYALMRAERLLGSRGSLKNEGLGFEGPGAAIPLECLE